MRAICYVERIDDFLWRCSYYAIFEDLCFPLTTESRASMNSIISYHVSHCLISHTLPAPVLLFYNLGSYLGTLYCGGKGFFLSPISFLKDPNVWLKSISRFRGTHTQVSGQYSTIIDQFSIFLLCFYVV